MTEELIKLISCAERFIRRKDDESEGFYSHQNSKAYIAADFAQSQLAKKDGYIEELKTNCDFALEGKDVEIMELKQKLDRAKFYIEELMHAVRLLKRPDTELSDVDEYLKEYEQFIKQE